MNKFLFRIFLCFLIGASTVVGNQANATHLYGGDLGYTYVSGNTYKVTLTLYANCAGNAFPTLAGATASVDVYNGATSVTTLVLPQEIIPIEVTPVCPAQANQTACFIPSSSIPGIKKFVFSLNYNVLSQSTNWRFRFNGATNGAAGSAGRSLNITNIVANTSISLEATLNNTVGNNSSPVYTTIPTPFFCVNKAASYNPGTIDADGDSLTFALVPGILPVSGTVTYVPPYTATAPLSSVPSTFTFSATNGQLDFTPDNTQKSLVVSQVYEYRGGTLVGTSMREMTFVVLPCNNNPPIGVISSPSAGVTLINSTSVSICKEKGPFSYNINPTDADGNMINVSASGIPAGAALNITNNNTIAPTSTLNWDVTNVTPGNYTYFVTYTDNGCPLASKQTLAYTIAVLPNPKLTFNLISPATCFSKAVFTLTPADATSPYLINFGSITRAGVTGTITDSLAPGTYTFSVTATNGCTHDTSITLVTPTTTMISAQVTQNTCNATANGAVTINASNSTPPYTFAVGSGVYSAANTFGSLVAGTYLFHIKDQIGCVKDTAIAIDDSLKVHGAITVTDVACNGNATGAIQVTGNGGVSPYQYALGTALYSTTNTFGALNAGTYAVHIKDNLGCFKDTSAALVEPTKLAIAVSVTNLTCNGNLSGAITITSTGGTPNYQYAIGTGSYGASNNFSGLAAGTYTFHIKDAHSCIIDTPGVLVTQPSALNYTLAITNVLCNGGNTGSITVNAAGGTPAYTYAADVAPFASGSTLGSLNAGNHIVHLKDNNGCIKDSTVSITQPAVLNMAYIAVDPACFASNNGTITITGNGGTTPYSFALNANPFTASGAMTNLAPGNYAVHIKDANNCTHDTTATLVEPTKITVSATVKRPRCTPLVNGMVSLTAGGGTPGYTYASGSGVYVNSSVFNNLGSGTYTFHIKDTRNCIKDTTITLTDSVAVHATTTLTSTKCFSSADGAINIVPSGGDLPYTYAVNTTAYSATNPIISLAAGNYTLHVKDANGCVLDTAQTITQPTIVVPTATITQPLCYQGTDGSVAMTATGGTAGYTFAIASGTYSAVANFTGLAAGTYIMHVRDANSCVRDTTVTIGQPTQLVITSLSLSHNYCNGDSSGIVTVRAGGATPAYTYAADARAFGTSGTLSQLKAGFRVIHVKDAHGCLLDTTVKLFEPTKVYLQIDTIINATCEGYKDGAITIAGATGGQPVYTYSSDNITFGVQRTFTGLQEGSYTVYAKDDFGCLADTTVNVTGYPHILVDGATVTNASCNGSADGQFTLLATGGNPSFTYYIQLPNDSNQTGNFDSLAKGVYAIHIMDATGCFKDTSVRIDQPDTLIVSATALPNDCVGYDNSGSVTITATGGTSPYSYAWSSVPAQSSNQITGLANGRYSVVVTDAHHCADSTTAEVLYDNCCMPYIVNAFTPNGDGRNDKFKVLFKGDIRLEDFSIYNRFGQRIFYTTSQNVGWDGTWNGVPQDLGTYFYYIRLFCGNKGDKIQEYKGDVTLIR